jgi:hypothetical protein
MEKSSIKYKWIASSDDGVYIDESEKIFDTENDCYNDMRNSALEKMKWNTEFDVDFLDVEDGDYIGYRVKFFKNKIIHTSYSGTYTYEIVAIDNRIKNIEISNTSLEIIKSALLEQINIKVYSPENDSANRGKLIQKRREAKIVLNYLLSIK